MPMLEFDPYGMIDVRANSFAALSGSSNSSSSEDRIFATSFKEGTVGDADDFDCFDGSGEKTKAKIVLEHLHLENNSGTTTGYLTGIVHSNFVKGLKTRTSTSEWRFTLDGFNSKQAISTEKKDSGSWFQVLEHKSGALEFIVKSKDSIKTEPMGDGRGDLHRLTIFDFQMANAANHKVAVAEFNQNAQVVEFTANA
ncbi:hypothetical protein P0136_04460 [Lentisphaerota bacterium ZTH]|nr:hypothetical protein JYG24_04420 [Lentisphaerota bacterium]WET07247.1 hypothetical protein P0136_04460 [Lentisphaerota bacterium ZTH]